MNPETFRAATELTPVRAEWFVVANADEIESPALLLYPDRVEENLRRMVKIAGDPNRLRPHAKTHKLGPIAALQIAARHPEVQSRHHCRSRNAGAGRRGGRAARVSAGRPKRAALARIDPRVSANDVRLLA